MVAKLAEQHSSFSIVLSELEDYEEMKSNT